MTINQIIRVSALIGIIGSVLAFIVVIGRIILGPDYANDSMNLTLVFIDNLSMSLMIIGFITAYLIQYQVLGKFGFFSFIVAIIGAMWVQGYSTLGFAIPVIKDLNPKMDLMDFANYPYPLLAGISSITILVGVGIILYGLSLLLYSKVSRWPGVALIIGGISSALQVPIAIMGLVSIVAFIISIFWLCIKVFNIKKVAVSASINLRT